MNDLFQPGGELDPIKVIERAVYLARPRKGKAERWVCVRDALGYGSTTSVALCRRFKLDPHEELKANRG